MESDEKEIERERLLKAFDFLGFPEEFGPLIARELGGPWSMRRMTSYLYAAQPTKVEQVADELIVILEERARIVDKLTTEEANAGWNAFLNRGED